MNRMVLTRSRARTALWTLTFLACMVASAEATVTTLGRFVLSKGDKVFWDGPVGFDFAPTGADLSNPGDGCDESRPCVEYELDVRETGFRLRVALDTPDDVEILCPEPVGNVFGLRLFDPTGAMVAQEFGKLSSEVGAENPMPGIWRARVSPEGSWAIFMNGATFRMRAKLEAHAPRSGSNDDESAANSCPGPQIIDDLNDARTDLVSNAENLDIVSAAFTAHSHDTLQITLTIKNLTLPPPPEDAPFALWAVYFEYGNTFYTAQAMGGGDPATLRYTAGPSVGDEQGSETTPNNPEIPGSFNPGPNGTIVFRVPLSLVGNPPAGTTLTRLVAGSYQAALVTVSPIRDRAPNSGFGADYTVGQVCIPGTEPVAGTGSSTGKLLYPNLRITPPFEFTLSMPGTANGCLPHELADSNGVHRCLRFSMGPENIGGPLHLIFGREGNATLTGGDVIQRIFRADGTFEERQAGTYEFHAAHTHFHHAGFASSELFRVTNAEQGTMELAGTGPKVGFCMGDYAIVTWRSFSNDLGPSSPSTCGLAGENPVSPEGTVIGLSPGWADVYSYCLEGNYVDFGTNPDGLYVVRVRGNHSNSVHETTTGDNFSYALIDVSGTSIDVRERGYGLSPWDPHKRIATDIREDVVDDLPSLAALTSSPDDAGTSLGPQAADVPGDNASFALGAARPNPTSSSVRISYSVARESQVSVAVYDVSGRLVRTLVSGRLPAGRHQAEWDARDDAGGQVRGGVYFYRMVAEGWQSQQKVIYLAR